MIKIKVPATSANMGPGFDSLGVALGLHNIINVSETDGGFTVVAGRDRRIVPGRENNLIYMAMNKVFEKAGYVPKGIRISQTNNIPTTRGFGSSSACIVAGMLGANVICGRPFDYREILDMAASMEGHPDNVTPALFGGFCTTVNDNGKISFTSNKLTYPIRFAIMYPDFSMATRDSRKVIPDVFSKEDVVFNISRATTFVSAMVSGKLDILKSACQDKIHQEYRKANIPGIENVFEKSYELGSYATYLSGSGPSAVSVIDAKNTDFETEMNKYFEENLNGWKCRVHTIDNVGAVVWESREDSNWR